MSNKVSIANAALLEVGANKINSFEDGTYEANLINGIWDFVVEQVLIQGGWTSLRRRSLLVRLQQEPVFGFRYMFQLPTNPEVIEVVEFNRDRGDHGQYLPSGRNTIITSAKRQNAFQVEGDKLLTNSEVAQIVYIAKIFDVAQWDFQLKNTVLAALKVRVAKNISAEASIVTILSEEYKALLTDNRSRNNQQASSVDLITDTFFTDY